MRETRLASIAAAMRLSTMAWPSTISITMMNAVSGACVTAARKAAMPIAMRAGPMSEPSSTDTLCPTPAPMDSDGAKMPPGTPSQADSHVAMNLRVTYKAGTSACPASMCLTASDPAPKVAPPVTRPMTATTRAPHAAKRSGKRARSRDMRSVRPVSEAASSLANRPPSTPQARATVRPGSSASQSSRGTWMRPK